MDIALNMVQPSTDTAVDIALNMVQLSTDTAAVGTERYRLRARLAMGTDVWARLAMGTDVWARLAMGTDVWARLAMGTDVWARLAMGTDVWARLAMGTDVWARLAMGTDVWARLAMGTNVCAIVSCSLNVPATCHMQLRDRSALTIVRAATLRQNVHIKPALSSSQSMLMPGRSVLALKLKRQGPCRIPASAIFMSLVGLEREEQEANHGSP